MCSNVGRSGAPTRPAADLAARLAAAIDELAAVARGSVSTGKGRTEVERADMNAQEPCNQDPANQDPGTQIRAERDLTERDLVERLARAWAMIIAADPEVAARTEHYSSP